MKRIYSCLLEYHNFGQAFLIESYFKSTENMLFYFSFHTIPRKEKLYKRKKEYLKKPTDSPTVAQNARMGTQKVKSHFV
jgi:hypothetical protein